MAHDVSPIPLVFSARESVPSSLFAGHAPGQKAGVFIGTRPACAFYFDLLRATTGNMM